MTKANFQAGCLTLDTGRCHNTPEGVLCHTIESLSLQNVFITDDYDIRVVLCAWGLNSRNILLSRSNQLFVEYFYCFFKFDYFLQCLLQCTHLPILVRRNLRIQQL